ncbi:hypothetical protein MZD04_gp044 [Pseudomonas phage Psa21]|uniref:Uncharacterized protein n=1 Tax=Pseudomonas phage Psa21 TaxID=2530023 RepID=A0A481W5B7_9CAUD|nr:hypothetical protein MZD04_gp044 [Pseudomonas phage Psa21]QBJ02574.1 hypothetical protein PSA21_44 [Pseudomonas phage Psa21]
MKHPEPQLTYSVLESNAGMKFADRFLQESMHDPEKDTWVEGNVPFRRALVNRFQKLVMDMFCDELFMETILESPEEELSQDMLDTFAIYQEFNAKFPQYDVIAIIPMNLAGTVGFVIQSKPMRKQS